MSSRPQSPSNNLRAPPTMEGPKESAVSRLLITPLTFISFLLSLALIDSRNHSLRTHSHSPTPPPPTTLLGRIMSFLHHCIYKRTPSSPYAYISESSTSLSSPKEKEPWHWHTKQRHMMKAEFSDAYRMRNSVLVAMVASGILAVVGLVYGVVGFGGWVKYVWTNWENLGTMTKSMHMGGQDPAITYGKYGESLRSDGL